MQKERFENYVLTVLLKYCILRSKAKLKVTKLAKVFLH